VEPKQKKKKNAKAAICSVGRLYRAINNSGALTTDPWSNTRRTITCADHRRLLPGKLLLLVEYMDMNEGGVWIWLDHDRVIWQVMTHESFNQCWALTKEPTE